MQGYQSFYRHFATKVQYSVHHLLVSQVKVSGVASTSMFTQNLQKVLNFLATKSGYQQPKSGSLSKFQVGYR